MKRECRLLIFGVCSLLAIAATWAGSLSTDTLTVNQQSTMYGQVSIGTATNSASTNAFVLYYSFDTNATPVTDGSTNANSGTVHAGATWTNTGEFAGDYQFDGTNGYIEAADANSLDIKAAFTISAWAKFDSTSSVRMLVGKSDDSSQRSYYLYFDTGALYCQISSSGSGTAQYSFNTSNAVSSSSWTHYVVTWDGTANANGLIYVNGVSQPIHTANATFSGTNIFNSTSTLRVGAKSNGNWYFGGQIDDVRVYNYALASIDILGIYQAGVAHTLNVDASIASTFSGTTTIKRLVVQGDIAMGTYTNGP